MPFTPFHFGPGAAIKAALGRRFSFAVFCFAQVATDCETGYYLLKGEYPWHRFCHTFLGATLVGAFSVLAGRPICWFAVHFLRDWFELGVTPRAPVAIPLVAAISGAYIGTYSHVVLDGIMHEDVVPFMPWSPANPFYGMMSIGSLHAWCAGLGFFGMLYAAGAYYLATSPTRTPPGESGR